MGMQAVYDRFRSADCRLRRYMRYGWAARGTTTVATAVSLADVGAFRDLTGVVEARRSRDWRRPCTQAGGARSALGRQRSPLSMLRLAWAIVPPVVPRSPGRATAVRTVHERPRRSRRVAQAAGDHPRAADGREDPRRRARPRTRGAGSTASTNSTIGPSDRAHPPSTSAAPWRA